MTIDPKLLEIHTHDGPSYQPLVDYQSWRVAVLNFVEHLAPERLADMQRHDETDEVFVLLHGRCLLFVADGDEQPGAIQTVDLEPRRIYNVKRGVWHNHALTAGASVLVVENRDTTKENSPTCALSAEQRAEIAAHAQRLWADLA